MILGCSTAFLENNIPVQQAATPKPRAPHQADYNIPLHIYQCANSLGIGPRAQAFFEAYDFSGTGLHTYFSCRVSAALPHSCFKPSSAVMTLALRVAQGLQVRV